MNPSPTVRKPRSVTCMALCATVLCFAKGYVDTPVSAQSASLAAVTVADPDAPIDTRVVTSQGVLEGVLVQNTRVYRGIPYAQVPARFSPAQPASAWTGVRVADTFGPSCVQPRGAFSAAGPQSEDCLSLNVYAPNNSNAPVMVFIHGGAFVTGAGNQFEGLSLAETGQVVVVTINYRLGALGFLSLPELDAGIGAPSGNNGFRDQQLALSWIKNNIRSFGGDPENVTVFGESAGAVSSCIQMVSPLSRTLGKRFIMQSGTCDSVGTSATLAQARATSARVVDAVCAGRSDVVACLREVPASNLVAVPIQTNIFDLGFLPVVNPADPLLPQSPKELIEAGDYNKGGSIIGTNARELALFQLGRTAPVVQSIVELNALIDARFGPAAAQVKQQYRAGSDAEANTVLIRLGTDLIFRCPARALARRTSARGSRAFLYHFEEGDAFHAYELPYVFGAPNTLLGAATLVDLVQPQFQTAFTSFAAAGEPSVSLFQVFGTQSAVTAQSADTVSLLGEFPWPEYKIATDLNIAVRQSSVEDGGQRSGLSKADCDLLESVGAVQ